MGQGDVERYVGLGCINKVMVCREGVLKGRVKRATLCV